MRGTCVNVLHMSKMIQIRNVPDDLHRTLKARAAQAGLSLSDYLLREVRKTAERPTLDEVLSAIKSDGSVSPKETSAQAVRAERRAR
jgi:plasmid stability protein